MATITLTADTNYSALTLANDDTIDCAGFILTLDEQPTETGVQVTSPGTNGQVVFSGSWTLPTWGFFAGSNTPSGMIGTLPTGATIGSATGGGITNARCVATNNGTITTVSAGVATVSYGCTTNNGTITTAKGGSGASAIAVSINNGTVTTVEGGTATNAFGIASNNGTVITSNGGTGSSAFGIQTNNGQCLRLSDGDGGVGVSVWNGRVCFVEGPHIAGIIPDNIKTIYSFGTLSGSATIAGDAVVTTLSEGTGGTARPVNPFSQQVIG